MTPPQTPPFDSARVWNGAAAYFEPRERGYWETARAYYPDADFETATAPGGGDPLYYAAFASREILAARQGPFGGLREGRRGKSRALRIRYPNRFGARARLSVHTR